MTGGGRTPPAPLGRRKDIAMPSIVCACGNAVDLSRLPTPEEWSYFKSDRWNDVIECVATAVLARHSTDAVLIKEAASDALAGLVASFYACPKCGRLIFPNPSDGLVREYKPVRSVS